MKAGNKILVLPSVALSRMKLDILVGSVATITEVVMKDNAVHGCWAEFPHPVYDETEWFIPYISIGEL